MLHTVDVSFVVVCWLLFAAHYTFNGIKWCVYEWCMCGSRKQWELYVGRKCGEKEGKLTTFVYFFL